MAIRLKIESLVYGGAGLARTENGKVVFVPYVLPGETVEVEELRIKGNHFIANVKELIEPGEYRIAPPCEYYEQCGGCQYQHIAYRQQLELKRQILKEQLTRLGGLSNVNVGEMVESENPFAYRNHVQFHLTPEGKVGFQQSMSHDVIAVEKCLLVEDPINELIKSISFEPDAGLQRVSIRYDDTDAPLLNLNGSSPNPPEFEVDFPLNVVYTGPAGEMGLSGENFNIFEFGERSFRVSAGSFFQVNRGVAEKMAIHLLNQLNLENSPLVMDLYCGVGFFSAYLAEKAGRLIGIESSEDACEDFVINLDAFEHIELYQGNVEDILPHLELKADIVVIDPPRAEIAKEAIHALIQSKPMQIAYISCDPSTLARDLKAFVAAGYMIKNITPFDMFPQTYHIECVTILTLSN